MANTNQKKIVTTKEGIQRYTAITGLSSLILSIPVFFFVISPQLFLAAAPGGRTADERTEILLYFLVPYLVISLIAFFIAASTVRKRYDFLVYPVSLLRGIVDLIVYMIVPFLLFWGIDITSYHSISVAGFVLLLVAYYCIGYFAFRGKTGSTSL